MVNTKTVFVLLLGGLLLVGLFVAFKPSAQPAVTAINLSPPQAMSSPTAAASPTPSKQIFQLQLQGGEPVGGAQTLRVQQGQTVELRLLSDTAGELHMHGYDLHADVRAGETTQLKFVAEHAGRYEIELHGDHHIHADLAALEVLPP